MAKEIGGRGFDPREEISPEKQPGSPPVFPESNDLSNRRMTRRALLRAGIGASLVAATGGLGVLIGKELGNIQTDEQDNSSGHNEEIIVPSSPVIGKTMEVDPLSTSGSIFTPTEVSKNTPTVEPTATFEPTSTPTEVPPTSTPEPEPTKEVTYPGRMEYKLDMDITSEDFPIHELILNPLFNKDGMDAEQAMQRALIKAHYQAYISAHEGRKTPEELRALSPEEFQKRLLAGEDMSYRIWGHPKEAWDENKKAQSLIVDPARGFNFAVSTDKSLISGQGETVVRNIDGEGDGFAYAYIVDADGTLTCVLHTIAGANYTESTDGLFNFGWDLLRGAQLAAIATQMSGGRYVLSYEDSDPDIMLQAFAPPDLQVDNNKVVQFKEGGPKYTPILIKPE